MATIATLDVSLRARTNKFRKNMKRASRSFSTVQASIISINQAVQLLGTAFNTAQRAIGAFTGTFKDIELIAKTATKLGIASDRLAGLQFAAKKAGVETTQLNVGLQRMVRRISEAATGTGEAQGAIKALGLDAKELARLSPDEQFRAIARGMDTIETSGARVLLTFKLFDTEGVNLVNLFNAGTDSMEAAMRQAEATGAALNDIESQQVVAAVDAFADFQLVITGIARQIALHLSPLITAFAKEMRRAGFEGVSVAEAISASFEFVEGIVANVADGIEALKGVFFAVKTLWLKVSSGIIDAMLMITKVAAALIDKFSSIARAVGLSGFADKLDAVTNRIVSRFQKASDKIDTMRLDAEIASRKAFDRFEFGTAGQDVREFFGRVRKEAERTAKDITQSASKRRKQLGTEQLSSILDRIKKEEAAKKAAALAAKNADTDRAREAEDNLRAIENRFASLAGQEFRAIDLSRITIRGTETRQKKKADVEDKQLKQTNALLRDIRNKVGSGGGAAVTV